MDAAEAWLREHDLSYLKSRQGWRDLDEDGVYRAPPQEVPVGGLESVELLVGSGKARSVEAVAHRACHRCGFEFVPQTSWQKFCTEACGKQAARRRKRAA